MDFTFVYVGHDADTYQAFVDAGKVVTVTGKNYSKQLTENTDFTAKSGSLKLTLTKSYLDSLSKGEYTVTAKFKIDGKEYEGSAAFKITSSSGGSGVKTGDDIRALILGAIRRTLSHIPARLREVIRMYEEFFEMTATPFTRSIPVGSLYRSDATEEIYNRLIYASRKQLFAVLIGDPSAGKTTLLRRLKDTLDGQEYLSRSYRAPGSVFPDMNAVAFDLTKATII